MDDVSNLLEQLKKYQRQNKNLLSDNTKLHAKCKRLKMDKKQMKLQLQTHLQSNNNQNGQNYIQHQTLQFVNHHHIEMQKMIDNLLSHPTIIKSSVYKDLQYIASKLSYIQSKVGLATNGKTSTTSPPDLHSQRPTLTHKDLEHLAPRSLQQSITTNTSDASYGSHRRSKHKNKQRQKNKQTKNKHQLPNLNMLASRSSPYKPSLNKQKKNSNKRNDVYNDRQIYHKRTRSAANKKQSIQQQLKQLETPKFANIKGKVSLFDISETDDASSVGHNILHQLRLNPHRKDRSTIISTSSMAVSRATSIIEDLEEDLRMVDVDVDVPPLPPSPHIPGPIRHSLTHKRNTKHRPTAPQHKRKIALPFDINHKGIPRDTGHPTTPNSGYSAYYENHTTPIRSLRLNTGSVDTTHDDAEEEGTIGNIDCRMSNNTLSADTTHEGTISSVSRSRKRAQTIKYMVKSKKSKNSDESREKRHSIVDWYGKKPIKRAIDLVKLKPSLTNPPSNNIRNKNKEHNGENKKGGTHKKASQSVAIKTVCARPLIDLNAVSLKLQSHVNKSVPTRSDSTSPYTSMQMHGQPPVYEDIVNKIESNDNSGSNPSNKSTLKSNSVIIHESQDSETSIGDTSTSTNTTAVSISSRGSLLKKYNNNKNRSRSREQELEESVGRINFVFDFKGKGDDDCDCDEERSVLSESTPRVNDIDIKKQFESKSEKQCKPVHLSPPPHVHGSDELSDLTQLSLNRSPNGSSSYPPTFNLEMDLSFADVHPSRHKEWHAQRSKCFVPSRHNKTQSQPLDDIAIKCLIINNNKSERSEERVRSKWKINKKLEIQNRQSQSSSSSASASASSSSSCSSSGIETSSSRITSGEDDVDNDDNKDSECTSDGESDTYCSSSPTATISAEGGSRDDIINKVKLNSTTTTTTIETEGSTNTNRLLLQTPFNISLHSNDNVFKPDAISPFGFSMASKRSKTVSAVDMVSKRKRNKLLTKRKKHKHVQVHRNGIKKHSSFTHIDEMSYDDAHIDEMLNEYRLMNIEEEKGDEDGSRSGLDSIDFCRRISVEEKQKLLIIDDLIASILSQPSSYLMTRALLLSYRAFTSSELLMRVLRRRFRVPHDYVDRMSLINTSDGAIFSESQCAFKIQLGISQLIYAWMHSYWSEDFESNGQLKSEMAEFRHEIDKFIVDQSQKSVICKLLKEPLLSEKRIAKRSNCHNNINAMDAQEEIRTRFPHLVSISACSVLIPDKLSIFKYKSYAMAQQIVLMDYAVFGEIRAREIVAQAWKKEGNCVSRMINQFNSVCHWVQLSILNCEKQRERAKMMKHMILIAKTLLEYQDFSALCAVHSALVSTPIKRLRPSWKKLNKKYIKMIENISSLFEWNSPKLAALHESSRGAVIPHLGIILKNVISIEESSEYKADGTINTRKMNLLAQQCEQLMKWKRNCDNVYSDDETLRKMNKMNKRFEIKRDIVLQKLLFRQFENQILISDDDIFEMSKCCV